MIVDICESVLHSSNRYSLTQNQLPSHLRRLVAHVLFLVYALVRKAKSVLPSKAPLCIAR